MRTATSLLAVCATAALAVAGCFPAPHQPGPRLAHFPEAAPSPGKTAPDFVLESITGEEVRLGDLIGERPVVLQVGSRSCPVFRYRRFGMGELYDEYRDRVRFVVVYSREAHPVGSKSPYTEGEWDLAINRLAGVRLGDPSTYDERRKRARESRDVLKIEAEVLVDGMDDRVWRLYGAAPSPAYVIDRGGRVVLTQAWVDPGEIRETLEGLLAPSETTRHRWLPEGSVYAPYLAEISRPGFGLTVVGVADNGIAEAGDLRFGLKLGGRLGLLRIGPPPGREGRAWQLDLGAGFYGQFDIDHSLDNIGWDGLYGLVLSSAPTSGRGLGLRMGVQHWSSHVGDEYAERTGRRRIGYTREEVMAGVAWPGLLRDRRWRAGITLYDGRTPIGELFQSDERYAVAGLWLDLERTPSGLR